MKRLTGLFVMVVAAGCSAPAASLVQPTPQIIYVTQPPVAAAATAAPTTKATTAPTEKPTDPPTPLPTAPPTPTPAPPTPMPTPTPEPKLTMAERYKAAEHPTYEDLFRNSEDYEFKDVAFEGEVIQVIDDGTGTYTLRINVTEGEYFWDDAVLVLYTGDRILEEDIVRFVGTYTGPYTYESTLGGDITVPAFTLDDVEIKLVD